MANGKVFVTRNEKVGEIRKPVVLPAPPEELVKVATGPLVNLVALMFWKLRREYPEMAITINAHDIKGMNDSLEYNGQTPRLRAEARAEYVAFRVCDSNTGDMIVISENNEDDLRRSEEAKKVKRVKEGAAMMVSTVRGELSQGTMSNDSIEGVCAALMTLARA